jgi:hypothetical protein
MPVQREDQFHQVSSTTIPGKSRPLRCIEADNRFQCTTDRPAMNAPAPHVLPAGIELNIITITKFRSALRRRNNTDE